LFVNFDRSVQDDRGRRLTGAGARFIVRRLRKQLGAWSFKSPHVARHTTATTLLEVTGGDVRLVQEVLGHANLNTLQGYTKIVDSRKQEAYRRYQEFLDGKKPPETRPAKRSAACAFRPRAHPRCDRATPTAGPRRSSSAKVVAAFQA